MDKSSIKIAISAGWQWVLQHNEATSGHEIFFNEQEFLMKAVKDRVERSYTTSSNARRLYSRDSESKLLYAHAESFEVSNSSIHELSDCEIAQIIAPKLLRRIVNKPYCGEQRTFRTETMTSIVLK